MAKDKIFIFEFISGGGFNKVDMPSSLFCEGFGMLRSIVADFKSIDFEIHTMLDNRIFFLSKFLQADIIRKVKENENYLKIFKNSIEKCKYAFIIAPETSNILYKLTKIVKKCNKIVLSTSLNGIKHCTSKLKTYKLFKKTEINTPRTYRIPHIRKSFDKKFIIRKFRELNCPIIIKPDDGVGANSIYYFEKETQISNFLRKLKSNFNYNRNFILQEFIEGRDLSISLIGTPSSNINPLFLSINFQDINLKNSESEYYGGYTPVENIKEILKIISTTIKNIDLSKFSGYYGIDFVLKDTRAHFIEINPRLTTSYIGIRNVINANTADLVLKSKLCEKITVEIDYLYHSVFSRFELRYEGDKTLHEINNKLVPELVKRIPEFITPPITLNELNQEQMRYSCFIATKTRNLEASRTRVNSIVKNLENFDFNIVRGR